MVDARQDLQQAKALCRILQTTGMSSALMVVVNEGGMPALNSEWGFDDVVLSHAGPAEVDARIRLALTREESKPGSEMIQSSGVAIDEVSYQAKLNGRVLDLTFKEFELLRFLVAHPSRVFSREQLLSEVWGYDYYGTARTIDNFVQKLRRKVEADPEDPRFIVTVRGVGYKFVLESRKE